MDRIVATVGELVADLETHHDVEATNVTTSDAGSNLGALVAIEQTSDKPTPVPEKWRLPRSVLCIPGSTKLDEAAALVLAILWNVLLLWRFAAFCYAAYHPAADDAADKLSAYVEQISKASSFLVDGALAFFFAGKS